MQVGNILNGKYRIEKQLGKGGMGSVYLCTNIELGNSWAIKHVYKQKGQENGLLAEEEILKRLNHINLPQIVDVFYDETGTFIVESYIEGEPLIKKLDNQGYFDEETVIEWAKQLCEVLAYLHNLTPHPIIYRDMKPSNIIITNDNRAVIIDFGISREYKGSNTKDTFIAGTGTYAAPEQLTAQGYTDQRTDIYSLGVTLYHLLTGSIPEYNTLSLRGYNSNISVEMDYIVQKCIEKKLEDRYQSAEELKSDLDNIRDLQIQNERQIIKNKLIISGIIILSLISYTACFWGLYQVNKEKTVVLDINPKILVLSEQQLGRIAVEKIWQNGARENLDNKRIIWFSSNENVAKVENGEVSALNEGETQITGKLGNKVVQLEVHVSHKQSDFININLKYNKDYYVKTFAGNRERECLDGVLKNSSFLDPGSMAITSNNTIYVIDNFLRRIQKGKVETIDIAPEYIEPKIVRANLNDDIYFASKEWITEKEECRVGIFKLVGDNIESVHESNGEIYSFRDFAFDKSNYIYILEDDMVNNISRLVKLNLNRKTKEILKDDLDGINCITIDQNNRIYLASSENGTIYRWEKNKSNLVYIAGLYKQKYFVDGKDNRLFEPQRIYAYGENIYVIDRSTVRKLIMADGNVVDTETIAGQVTTESTEDLEGAGVDVIFGAGLNKDIVIDKEGNIFISDTENNIIRRIFRQEIKEPVRIKA